MTDRPTRIDRENPDAASGPGCERHKGDPHNLCQACWALERDPKTPEAMEARAAALVEYGNSLPDGVTTEAFAEASNLRREARELRAAEGVAASGREFPLDEILTVSTGRLVALRHMDAVYDVLNFLTGDSLFTHQLPRALEACKPSVLAQHPDLVAIVVPEFGEDVHAELIAWLAVVKAEYGSTRTLVPVGEWESRDPVEELCDMVGPEKVYVFPEAPDGD